jgi:hypothetical protein
MYLLRYILRKHELCVSYMLNKTRQREATSVLHVKAGARVSDEIEHSLG